MNAIQAINILSIVIAVTVSVFFILVALCRLRKLKFIQSIPVLKKAADKLFAFIIIYIFNRLFLKEKLYYKDYGSNLIEMKKWFNEEVHRDVMIMRVMQAKEKFIYVKPQTSSTDAVQLAIIEGESFREQYRAWERSSRKRYKTALYYVEDNFFTRLAGYKKGIENRRLAA